MNRLEVDIAIRSLAWKNFAKEGSSLIMHEDEFVAALNKGHRDHAQNSISGRGHDDLKSQIDPFTKIYFMEPNIY